MKKHVNFPVNDPKSLNQQQSFLRKALEGSLSYSDAIELFLCHHASLHAYQIESHASWSYPREIVNGLKDKNFRIIPEKLEHSIAWCFWHLARIEDITLNILVANAEQIFTRDKWQDKLNVPYRDTGNTTDPAYFQLLNEKINIKALLTYRDQVGLRTREIVHGLDKPDLSRKVDPARVQNILDIGAVTEEARGIAEYWSRRTVTGLLLMPASRHILVHLNEAAKIRNRVQK